MTPMAFCWCNKENKERNGVLLAVTQKGVSRSMGKHAYSSLLAALIALPMYYMFYSMFNDGFQTGPFLVALIIGAVTFVITLAIATMVGRQRQATS